MCIHTCLAGKMTELFGSSGLLKLFYSYFVFYLFKEFKVQFFFFPFGLFRLEKTFKIIEFCVFFCFGFFSLSSLSAVVGRITEIGPKMCTTAVKLQDHWLVGCPTLAASEIR